MAWEANGDGGAGQHAPRRSRAGDHLWARKAAQECLWIGLGAALSAVGPARSHVIQATGFKVSGPPVHIRSLRPLGTSRSRNVSTRRRASNSVSFLFFAT
jgi:hypothetical protein